jgi:hypothetical protein
MSLILIQLGSAPNGLICRDFSVVPDSVFLFSENSQFFFGNFLNFSQFFNLFFLFMFCHSLFSIKITHFFLFEEENHCISSKDL